VLAIRVQVKRE